MSLTNAIVVVALIVSAVHCTISETAVPLTSKTSASMPAVITCDYDGLSSNDTISWKYRNSSGVVSDLAANTMSINLTSTTDIGVYTCSVNGAVVATITAAFLAPPIIENTRQSVTFNDGDVERTLICKSEGSFPAVDFVWRRRDEGETTHAVLDPALDSNINITTTAESASLLFHNLNFNVSASYQCYVNNSAGNNTVEVLVRVKDRLAALWPFLGIVAEVLVLIAIIFAYEKRSKKAAQVKATEIKDDTETPLKTDSESGSELRNRMPTNNNK